MDRNSIIGLLLIGAIIIAYSIYTAPTDEQRKAAQHTHDSIVAVQHAQQKMDSVQKAFVDTVKTTTAENDSSAQILATQQLGGFASSANGKEEFYTIENNLIKVNVSSKGGRIHGVEL